MSMTFLVTDRKAGDASQAGADQTDGKLKDSKERWVAIQYMRGQTVQYLCSYSLGFLCLNH